MGIWHVFAVAAVVALPARPAVADVFEIGDDGAVVLLAGTPPRAAPPLPVASAAARPARALIAAAAARQALSPALVEAIAAVESAHNPAAVSKKGAIGTMQLMPATARTLGVDPHDNAANIAGGAAYLRQLVDHFDGDLVRAIAAYNAGPAAVERARGVPAFAETRAYVDRVLARLASGAR